MRVPPDELGGEGLRDVVEVEGVRLVLLREAGVEDDLQQDVPELLAQAGAVVGLDRLGELVRLLEHERHEALVGLLRVPGAAARGPQPVHDRDEAPDRVARDSGDGGRTCAGHEPVTGRSPGASAGPHGVAAAGTSQSCAIGVMPDPSAKSTSP